MSFLDVQKNFMDYIKDPSQPLPNGIEARRMKIYRELFFTNVDGFVSNAFPVLKSLYKEEDWLAIVQNFFVTHDCHSPIFIEIAQEFLLFLQTEYKTTKIDPPFMLELAHYEWLELVVAVAQDNHEHKLINLTKQNLEAINLSVSSTAKIAQYAYDVQHISPDYRPKSPSKAPQFFCIYRDLDEEVCFLQLNPLTAQVLAYMSQHTNLGYTELVDWLVQTFTHIYADALKVGCLQLLTDLSQKGIIKQFIGK
ncbi:HvfC family RiPP maturation protein [Shewanella sp. 30m-9]